MVTRGRTRAATLDLSKLPLLGATSALGHKRTWCHVRVMSVIPFKADIHQRGLYVRLVPKADFDYREGPLAARSPVIRGGRI